MDNLNKDNFFNEIMAKFPKAMKKFCDWIDQYKKRVDWNKLFNSDSNWQDQNGKNAPAPKYHDLPIEMQIGIYIQFCKEIVRPETVHEWEIEDLYEHDWKADFIGLFAAMEQWD